MMFKALFYKEWLKTRWIVVALFAISALMYIYLFVRLGRSLSIAGEEHIWDVVVNRNQFLFFDIMYFPLLCGLLLGLFQFVPELAQKRLKLTLHLPMAEVKIVWTMLAYGAGLLIGLYLIQLIVLFSGIRLFFANEILVHWGYTIAPWFLAGLSAYFATASVCLEPSWRRKIIMTLVSAGFLRLFFLSSEPGSYSLFVLWLPLVVIMMLLFVFLSVMRFKVGIQD